MTGLTLYNEGNRVKEIPPSFYQWIEQHPEFHNLSDEEQAHEYHRFMAKRYGKPSSSIWMKQK